MKKVLIFTCILNACLLPAMFASVMQTNSLDLPESSAMCDRQLGNSYKTLINVELAKLRALQKTFEKASARKPTIVAGAVGMGIAAIALVLSVGPELFRDRFIAVHQFRNIHNIMVNSCQVLHNVGLTVAAAPWIAAVINCLLNVACESLERAEPDAAAF
jgi:hypothetical protein